MTYSHCESCGFTRVKHPYTIALTCPRCRARTGKTVMLVDRRSARFSRFAVAPKPAESLQPGLDENPESLPLR
jgi:uncharacterized Zn finger protein (UPF0148 family)